LIGKRDEDRANMCNLQLETLVALCQAGKLLPGRPHVSTLYRWHLRGIRGIRLETILIGGRRYTSQEALERFFAATTAAANGAPTPPRTPKQRQRAIEQAEREIAAGSKTRGQHARLK
jgi:hypothetical protein